MLWKPHRGLCGFSKQVKRETALSSGISSVSYAAIHYIKNTVEKLSEKNVVLFGLGKIGLNTCENLVKNLDNKQITVVNRTEEKSIEAGKKFSVLTQPIQDFEKILSITDILIVATGADTYTVQKEIVGNREKPLLILDLSIPNNVEEDIDHMDGIKLINVDMLSSIINKTMTKRESEIPKAEKIIQDKINEFNEWLSLREFVPFIQSFKEDLQGIKSHLSHELNKKNASQTEAEEVLSDQLIQKLTNKFACYILENQNEAENTLEVMKRVFRLKELETQLS